MRVPTMLSAVVFGMLAGCANTSVVTDEDLEISFSPPVSWGTWQKTANPTLPDTNVTTEMTFAKLAEPKGPDMLGVFRRYDKDKNRYEEICDKERSVDLCDVTKRQDLLAEKAEFEASAEVIIDNLPATIEDYYDVSGAHVVREVRFYTPSYRVEMYFMYDLADFLVAAQLPAETDLHTTANRVFGNKISDPIHALGSLELNEAEKYFDEVTSMLHSISIQN